MKTTLEQRDAVLGLFNFVEQVTGIRLAKTKNIDNNDWKLLLSDIDAKLPGVRELWPNADEDDLLLRIVKLNIPTCPAPTCSGEGAGRQLRALRRQNG